MILLLWNIWTYGTFIYILWENSATLMFYDYPISMSIIPIIRFWMRVYALYIKTMSISSALIIQKKSDRKYILLRKLVRAENHVTRPNTKLRQRYLAIQMLHLCSSSLDILEVGLRITLSYTNFPEILRIYGNECRPIYWKLLFEITKHQQ